MGDGFYGDGDIQRGWRDHQDCVDGGVRDEFTIIREESQAVTRCHLLPFVNLVPADGDELSAGIFFDEMSEIPTAMTSNSNEPH